MAIHNIYTIKKSIRELISYRTIFSHSSAKKKYSIINKLSKQKYLTAAMLVSYHDILSFIRAYPDNAKLLKLVELELKSFTNKIERYKKLSRDKKGIKLANSGMVNTITEHPYSLGTIELLTDKYPNSIDLDLELNDEVADNISSFAQHLVAYQENDTLDNDESLDMTDWLTMAQGKKTKTNLATIVKMISQSELPRQLQIHFYDNLDITAEWNINNANGSRTLKRVPYKKHFFQNEPIKRRSAALRTELNKPIAQLTHLSQKDGQQMVETINEVLAVRNRELYPLTYSNCDEVYRYDAGRGVEIYLFGMLHEIRLPLETNYGAMIVRNGLPIGYGIAATLFDRVEIAINIFPAFRAGESAFIFEQFFKLFYSKFGSKLFLVRSYQMGDGDEEPLKSGALWFYYKLGFRAVKPNIRRMVDREYKNIAENKKHRTPIAKLRRLAKSDVFMHADPNQMDSFSELSLIDLGKIITRYTAAKFDGNRKQMIEKSIEKISKVLPLKNWHRWHPDEVVALQRMAPLVANIKSLSKWNTKEKSSLVEIIKSKGSTCERKYSLLMSKHGKLKSAVEKLADGYRKKNDVG